MLPAQTLLEDLLLDTNNKKWDAQPRHRQIYGKIRQAILDNYLAGDTLLPPTRHLAKQLSISRNTVVTAYDQLMAEGLITSQRGSGTRVAQYASEPQTTPDQIPASKLAQRLKKMDIALPYNTSMGGSKLLPGLPDMAEFPYKTWSQLFNRHQKALAPSLQDLDMAAGLRPLRHALSQYLKVSRGVSAEEDQIFITAGASQSLQLITRVLTDPGDYAWIEEPGYTVAKKSLQMADLNISPIPLDQHGMAPELMSSAAKEHAPTLIYLTPSFQYPMGYTMSTPRRLDILNQANRHKAWIIEDDYDGEFRYRGQPIPALLGLKNNQRTLYMGTFSKILSPAFRISYIVVPQGLVDPFRQAYPMLGNESSVAIQAALAEFISRGYFSQHIKRMRKLYGSRREVLEQELQKIIGSDKTLIQGGLHIPVTINKNDHEIMPHLANVGLGCVPLSHFFHTEKKGNGLLIGFTDSNEEKIIDHCKLLRDVLEQYKNPVSLDFI